MLPELTAMMQSLPERLMPERLGLTLPSPEVSFAPDWPGADTVTLQVKRDDLIHPLVSGNKWRKLKYALPDLLSQTDMPVLSFGGGHSNHMTALGYCCHRLGLPFIALIRGDYRQSPTPMLNRLNDWGTKIHYLSKVDYQRREDEDFLQALYCQFPGVRIVPEGGSQQEALQGVADIWRELNHNYDYLIAPVASGGTLAGLIQSAEQPNCHVLGIGVLKGRGYLEGLVNRLLPSETSRQWQILHDYHQGGYAKTSPALVQFCQNTERRYGMPLEPVYSGKVFWALKELLAAGYFPSGARILVLHTGGLPLSDGN